MKEEKKKKGEYVYMISLTAISIERWRQRKEHDAFLSSP
jgi:hypothetical protein